MASSLMRASWSDLLEIAAVKPRLLRCRHTGAHQTCAQMRIGLVVHLGLSGSLAAWQAWAPLSVRALGVKGGGGWFPTTSGVTRHGMDWPDRRMNINLPNLRRSGEKETP